MSLIVSVRTSEGLVMASDSRMTTTVKKVDGSGHHDFVGAHFSDTTYKTFALNKRIGVSTCGDAFLKGRAIAGWMQTFETQYVNDDCSLLECSQRLASYFGGIKPEGELIFHIGGYELVNDVRQLQTYRLVIDSSGKANLEAADVGCGARWDGQKETLTRLLKSSYIVDERLARPLGDVTTTVTDASGQQKTDILKDVLGVPRTSMHYPESNIDFAFFTLQDAVDFAIYAIRTTIDTMRFKSEPLTVAEPIDVLVITPEKATWLIRKELHI